MSFLFGSFFYKREKYLFIFLCTFKLTKSICIRNQWVRSSYFKLNPCVTHFLHSFFAPAFLHRPFFCTIFDVFVSEKILTVVLQSYAPIGNGRVGNKPSFFRKLSLLEKWRFLPYNRAYMSRRLWKTGKTCLIQIF